MKHIKMEMLNKKNKPLLIIFMIIAGFVLIVSLASLYTERVVSCGEAQTCTIPLPFLIPIIASVSLFVGSLIGYFMVGKLLKKENKVKRCSGFVEKLFSPEELCILKLVAESNKISQAEISRKSKLPRLKVFRIIEKLKERKIVEKYEEDGKTRIIKMDNDLRDLFKN
jgi:uncharacterized membrane protein